MEQDAKSAIYLGNVLLKFWFVAGFFLMYINVGGLMVSGMLMQLMAKKWC